MFIGIIKDDGFNGVITRTLCIIYTLINHIFNVIGFRGTMPMKICGILHGDTLPVVAELVESLEIGIVKAINSIMPIILVNEVTIHNGRIPRAFAGEEDMWEGVKFRIGIRADLEARKAILHDKRNAITIKCLDALGTACNV